MGDNHSFTFHQERKISEKISEELHSRGFELSPEQVENKIKTIEIDCKIDVKQDEKLQYDIIKQESETNNNPLTNR